MKKVMTYGRFDLLHYGHVDFLKRAKALGDYLIIVLKTDDLYNPDKSYFTYEERKSVLEALKFVDLIIPEVSYAQLVSDVQEQEVDVFVMGADDGGKFDFLKDHCEVLYLPRYANISTSQIIKDLGGKKATKKAAKKKKAKKFSKKNIKAMLTKVVNATPFTQQMAENALVSKRKRNYRKNYMNKYATDEKVVLFEAFMGRQVSCSPKAIYTEMMKDPKFDDYLKVWALKEPEDYEALNDDKNTIVVKFRSPEYFMYCAMAKYWITNSRMPRDIDPKPDQQLIQCWHGVPLKRIRHDVELYKGSKYETKKYRDLSDEDVKRYSMILSPSKFYTETITSAFNLKKLGKEDTIFEVGYPRNDFLYTHTEEDVKRLKEKFLIPMDKKVILYAPTYRENQQVGNSYVYDLGLDFDKMYEELKDDYVVLFRTHYFVSNGFEFWKYNGFVIDVSQYDDINHLYVVSDMMITDYSSVMFDYANLKRPMLFYMYDMDEYKDEMRGFYIDLAELPGEIIQTEENLIASIKELDEKGFVYDEKYQQFNAKFNQFAKPCSRDVIDAVFK